MVFFVKTESRHIILPILIYFKRSFSDVIQASLSKLFHTVYISRQ